MSYPEAIRLAGGVTKVVETDIESGFRVTIDQLEQAKSDKTKVLLFVSPSNPTGAVYTAEETQAIGEWALANNIWVVTDEIYEHLTYGDATFHSILSLVPELADTCVIVNGVAKTYAMTGWRVGWMIGPEDVIKAATGLQSHATSNVANVSQQAALAAVAGPLDAVLDMRNAFDRRRRTMISMLREIPGLEVIEPQGAFYAFPEVTALLGRPVGDTRPETSLDLAAAILTEANVAVVPGEAFGAPGHFRLSYALGDEDLAEGVGRLIELFA